MRWLRQKEIKQNRRMHMIDISMIIKGQNSFLGNPIFNSNGLLNPLNSKEALISLKKYNSDFHSKIEETLNILLEEYHERSRIGFHNDYENLLEKLNVTSNSRDKRAIPEIHMKKKESNTKLRACNDMSGILGI